MTTEKQIIVITGQDGSGKSTLIKKLIENLPNSTEVTIWDALDPELFNSKQKIDDYLSELTPNSRVLFLAHALMQSMELALKTQYSILLINGYFYKYFSSELALGANKQLVKRLSDFFPKSNKVIKLNISSDIAFKRKTKITKYECGLKDVSEQNFISFQDKSKLFWKNFETDNWIYIDSSHSITETYQSVTSKL